MSANKKDKSNETYSYRRHLWLYNTKERRMKMTIKEILRFIALKIYNCSNT